MGIWSPKQKQILVVSLRDTPSVNKVLVPSHYLQALVHLTLLGTYFTLLLICLPKV